MDTVTQAVLGAAVGQAFYADKLGRKANWYGAMAGLIPDLDVISRPLGDEWQSLLWHRGATHSIWFGPVVGTALGYCVWRYYHRKARTQAAPHTLNENPLSAWIGLFVLGILTHPLLDVFTTYGTQLLSPFSHVRYSLNGVGIIDPIYTGILAIALGIGWRSRTHARRSKMSAFLALIVSSAYLLYGVHQNDLTKSAARQQLVSHRVKVDQLHAYPTLFQPWLRRVVAWTGSEVKVGYYSTLTPQPISWTTRAHHREDPRVKALVKSKYGALFQWFSNDQLVAESVTQTSDLIRLHDFRYGMIGHEDESIWGIEAKVSQDAQVITDVRRFRNRPSDIYGTLQRMLNVLLGRGQ